ncbi:MAG: DUF2490 domain-containing protein [Candidatus Omnitrophica bacterium]|nr:DUF2490 domain-containing protein [Candidatus Omnitrophota bacterium]MBU4148934.1 DUF2490 domain-containing protein [Candidatus Omnitrophota bacterium]
MTGFYKSIITGGVALSAIFLCHCVYGFDDGDWQYWNTESASVKLVDEWKASIEQEFRWGNDMHNPYYNHTDVGIAYSGLADWFDLSLNYRHIKEEKSNDWKTEYRPYVSGTIKWKIYDFSFSDRSRFEFRERQDADEAWQYRNKLSLKPPISLTKFKIQPYVEDETFFDSDSQELNRNRLYSGASFNIFKDLKGDIFYLWQRSKSSSSGKWTDVNAVGTKLKISF